MAVDALGVHTILGVEQVVGDADGAVGALLVREVDREGRRRVADGNAALPTISNHIQFSRLFKELLTQEFCSRSRRWASRTA